RASIKRGKGRKRGKRRQRSRASLPSREAKGLSQALPSRAPSREASDGQRLRPTVQASQREKAPPHCSPQRSGVGEALSRRRANLSNGTEAASGRSRAPPE